MLRLKLVIGNVNKQADAKMTFKASQFRRDVYWS